MRFSAQLGYRIEDGTKEAIRNLAPGLKRYLFRMPPVFIIPVNAVGGHLEAFLLQQDRHRTMTFILRM